MSRPVPSGEEQKFARRATADVFGDPDAGSDLTWGVGAVSERLEVTASTLRTWERRYGVGPSFRTQGGHRRYTERDIDLVELMRRLVGRGVSAQDAARVARALDRDELELALTDELSHESLAPEDLVDAVMASVVTGDLERLSQLFAGLLRGGPLTDAWREVLSPALVRMSCESSAGTLPIESESAATSVLVAELRARVFAERLPETGRTAVLFARNVPTAEAIPIFALEAALSQAGVATRAVGPEAGSRLVASLVTELRPDVLVTWGHPSDPALRRALDKLDGVTFVVRALPAWPHEIGLRFGIDGPLVSTDVSGAVERLLDRVS
ncbi:MAG: MerR family transcriptional regulator [Aeromicrobium sp.]